MNLREKIITQVEDLNKQIAILSKFPDVEEYRGRWKTIWKSPSVNSLVNDVHIHHNCGCCEDSPLEAWPFIEVDGVCIYSDPPRFVVGEKSGSGEREYVNWSKALVDKGIPQKILDKIQENFDKNPPT